MFSSSSSLPVEQRSQDSRGDTLSRLLLAASLIDELTVVNGRANFVTYVRRDAFTAQINVLCARSHCAQQHNRMHLFAVGWELALDFRWFRCAWFSLGGIVGISIGGRRWLC